MRRRSGSDKVVFIVDEVGQYIAGRDDLILNLDGLAKNIKNFGKGKAWLVATAQQTLTEDSAQAQLNSPKLFKLKDRFPVAIDLEANDIKTICHRRLLAKSPKAREELGKLFDNSGQKIIHATKLSQAKVISSALDRDTFIDLYPFLPQHLELLLLLLGRLAKTSGGVGLRSAIKVVQDVLVDSGLPGGSALADAPVGALANVVIFYDCLKRDIQRSFPHVIQGVDRAISAFGADSMAGKLAKAVGVLQVIEEFPLTAENAAALMLPSVESEPLFDAAREAVKELLDQPLVPLAEVDGRLRFMSPVVDDLNKKRLEIQPGTVELRDIYVVALRDLFSPKPSSRTSSGKSVAAGIKLADATGWFPVLDDSEEILLHLALQKESQHQSELATYVERSRTPEYAKAIFLVAPEDRQIEQLALDYYRCTRIYDLEHARALDKDAIGFLNSQRTKAANDSKEIIARLQQSFLKGSFIFRGQPVGVSTLSAELATAVKNELGTVGEEVFHKYKDAAVQAEGSAAEGFLRTPSLLAIAAKNDPLSLVDKSSASGTIRASSLAFHDLVDYLETRGLVEGKKLLDDFSQAPYGWFKDTTRYIVAAMLAAGSIKLRVGGIEMSTPTPQAIDALKGPQQFNKIGVMLRGNPPSVDLLIRTSDRLLELTGKSVPPLERDIANAVLDSFPDFQTAYSSLSARLSGLGLSGAERAEDLCDRIAELLKGDGSDAPYRLGPEDSALYRDLCWARDSLGAFKDGAGALVERARRLTGTIERFPDDGGPLDELKSSTRVIREELLAELRREDWHARRAEISQKASELESAVAAALHSLSSECMAYAEKRWAELEASPEFSRLGSEEREALATDRPLVELPKDAGLGALQSLVNLRYGLTAKFDKLVARARAIAEEADENSQAGEPQLAVEEGSTHSLRIPRGPVRSLATLDEIEVGVENARQALQQGKTVIIE